MMLSRYREIGVRPNKVILKAKKEWKAFPWMIVIKTGRDLSIAKPPTQETIAK